VEAKIKKDGGPTIPTPAECSMLRTQKYYISKLRNQIFEGSEGMATEVATPGD